MEFQLHSPGWITEKPKEYLTSKYPITPVFYCLPKIHKHHQKTLGRPIIAGSDYIFKKPSKYIDTFLQTLVCKQDSYVQDTTDLLNKIGIIKPNEFQEFILVTMDVQSRYNNIPHDEKIDSVSHVLLNSESIEANSEFLLQLQDFVLHNNYFRFRNTYYLQKMGTAMGSNMASSYANLSLFENTMILSNACWKHKIHHWVRYIDTSSFSGPAVSVKYYSLEEKSTDCIRVYNLH